MSQPNENSTTAQPKLNQQGNAAVKLVTVNPPDLSSESQGPEFGDGDGDGPDDISDIHIDIADNGFLVTFNNIFNDPQKIIVVNKEELLALLGKRL